MKERFRKTERERQREREREIEREREDGGWCPQPVTNQPKNKARHTIASIYILFV